VVIRPIGDGDEDGHPARDLAAAEERDAVAELGVLDRSERRRAELERLFQTGHELVLRVGPRELRSRRRLLTGRGAAQIVVAIFDQVCDHVAEAHLGGRGLEAVFVRGHLLRGVRDVLGVTLFHRPERVGDGILLRRANRRPSTEGERPGANTGLHGSSLRIGEATFCSARAWLPSVAAAQSFVAMPTSRSNTPAAIAAADGCPSVPRLKRHITTKLTASLLISRKAARRNRRNPASAP